MRVPDVTPELWVAIAVAILPSFGALVLAFVNRQKLNAIHVEINSRLSQLVAATSRAEHAEGIVVGKGSAAELQSMIDAAIGRFMASPGSEALVSTAAATAAATATATATAMLTGEAREAAKELKVTAEETAERLRTATPHAE